ncbi:alkaline phosphatase D family protein [Paracoccus kondratievae]
MLYEVVTDLSGDLRLAFVSCNGEENGDLERDDDERNLMWTRLAQDHASAPFALLLQGGDQIYADEATQGHPLSEDWPDHAPEVDDSAALQDLARHLRNRFVERYLHVLRAPGYSWMAARVPTLAIWDDHDICDGWGSLPESARARPLARRCFRPRARPICCSSMARLKATSPSCFLTPQVPALAGNANCPA